MTLSAEPRTPSASHAEPKTPSRPPEPRDPATAAAGARVYPEQVLLASRPNRILVADDEHLIAAEMAFLLAELKYTTVGPATDGQHAISLARTALPDMALLDIRMPGVSGLHAASEIFHELAIPVVIVSAYSDEEFVNAARAAGVFGYLIKPATKEQLRAAIEVAWGRFLRHVSERSENDQLRKTIEERRTIEQAKWRLVSEHKISEPEAMARLTKAARNSRRRLVDLARDILDGKGDLPA